MWSDVSLACTTTVWHYGEHIEGFPDHQVATEPAYLILDPSFMIHAYSFSNLSATPAGHITSASNIDTKITSGTRPDGHTSPVFQRKQQEN